VRGGECTPTLSHDTHPTMALNPGDAVPTIASPLRLACGVTIPNRLAKAAMTEGMADELSRPSKELCQLYACYPPARLHLLACPFAPMLIWSAPPDANTAR